MGLGEVVGCMGHWETGGIRICMCDAKERKR